LSFQLANSIAQEKDHSVLLIDGDLARPGLSTVLDLHRVPGLTDLLLSPEINPLELVHETSVPGLWLLPAGRSSSLAPELVASARMRDVRDQLQALDSRRVLLFDSPPILASNEAQALAQQINQVLMVVRAESTSPDTLLTARRVLGEDRRIDFVLNMSSFDNRRSYYGDYYDRDAAGEES
jgi:MinD-like ATPase involved in chromosome partitioning or flagellar assembly